MQKKKKKSPTKNNQKQTKTTEKKNVLEMGMIDVQIFKWRNKTERT